MRLDYFFVYETKLPPDIGFRMFGFRHLLWLLLLLAAGAGLMHMYAGLSKRKRILWEWMVAFSMSVWIVVRMIYIAAIGERFLYELPLHLCSLTGILCGIHCVAHWDWTGQVLYAIGLPGAVLALLFPDWGCYPAVHFISIEGFMFHGGIVLYVASQLNSRTIVPDVGKIWQVILFLAAVLPPIYFFDRRFGVNYMFVNRPAAGSPLEILAYLPGKAGYLGGYLTLIALCVVLMELGFRFTKKGQTRTNSK